MNNKEYISNSIKTILEMLNDRNIDVSNINKDGYSEWVNNNYNKNDFSIVFNNVKVIYFLPLQKFKISDIKKILEDDETKYELILLVIKEKLSQNNLKTLLSLKLPIQIFDIKELQFNITHHILVPKHSIVNEQDVKKIINDYNIKNKFQLPHILKSDPISKYLGLKNGDVVKIKRISPTAGEYIIYRCCL